MDSETLNEQWARICAQVKSYQDIDPSQVSAFFSRLVPQAMSDSFLMLTADNDFIKTWVEQHYTEVIVRALRDLTGVVFAVAIAVDPTQEQRKIAAAGQPSPAAPLSAPAQPMPTPTPAQPAASTMESLPSQPIAAAAPPLTGLWCSPVSGDPLRTIRHGRPFPCRGRRGRSLRASRARTALPGAGRRAGFESLVFPHVRELRYRGIEPHGLLHGRRSCRVPWTASP